MCEYPPSKENCSRECERPVVQNEPTETEEEKIESQT